MNAGFKAGAFGAVLAGAAVGVAFYSHQRAMQQAEDAWRRIASRSTSAPERFSPAMVAELPEIGRRYFNYAIEPGTPLLTTVELEMDGTFLLGDRQSHQTYSMQARQILQPPSQFVWIPRLQSGMMRITGSDALVGGEAWTRFWLLGLVPVADSRSSPDLVRSAAFRSAMEGIWVPACLLPRHGVTWEQTGPNEARLHFTKLSPTLILRLALAPDGSVREVVGERWSNANADQQFRLQPFGGTIHGNDRFGGYRIPTNVRVGNHYGTADYLPFFQARVRGARFL
ncbi:MAG TPA: DUF6544 family protein [Allosphingosinicella sp.]|jgi:hypothetical protein